MGDEECSAHPLFDHSNFDVSDRHLLDGIKQGVQINFENISGST